MLEINVTLIYQLVVFFILLVVIKRFLLEPVLNVLEKRDREISGRRTEAVDVETAVEQGLMDYDKRLRDATAHAQEERARIRQQGLDRERELIDAARNEAMGELAKIRDEVASSKDSALEKLKAEAKDLSTSIAEKVLDRKLQGIVMVPFFLLMPALAFASEGGPGGGMGWKLFNFAILAAGLYYVWIKYIKTALEQRTVDIEKAIENAKTLKSEAEAKKVEYEAKLALLDKRVGEIEQELKLEGEAEKKRIIAEAEVNAARLKEDAKLTAAQEIKKARAEIHREVASYSVEMAAEILKKEIKGEDQERLVEDYLQRLRLEA